MFKNKLLKPLLWFFLIASVFLALIYASTYWQVSTRVHVELVTDRLQFSLAEDEMQTILPSLPYHAFSVTKFSSLKLSPEEFVVADPSKYDFDQDKYPDNAWVSLSDVAELTIQGDQVSRFAYVSFESSEEENSELGKLYQFMADGNAIVDIEYVANDRKQLLINTLGKISQLQLHFDAAVYMDLDGALPQGISMPEFDAEQLRYRFKFAEYSRLVEINSHSTGLDFTLTLPDKIVPTMPLIQDLPISSINFLHQGQKGEPESSIVGEGKLSYPGYPNLEARKIDRFLRLEQLEKFSIRELQLSQTTNAMSITLEGIVDEAITGYGHFSDDLTLTLFHVFRHDWRLAILFSVLAFLIYRIPAAIKFYKDLAR